MTIITYTIGAIALVIVGYFLGYHVRDSVSEARHVEVDCVRRKKSYEKKCERMYGGR